MNRIKLDLFELQAFTRLAERRSYRAAAEELGLSGPALSRLIVRIEEKLGARLFDRDTRNVALTPQGERLRELSGRILSEAEEALGEFDSYLAARRGRLVLAGLPSITAGLLPKVVARFIAERPEVEVSLLDALSEGVIAAVLEGRADFGFTAGAMESSGRLAFRPLLRDPFVAVGAAGGPLEARAAWTWSDLLALPFVAMSPGTSVRALTDAACAQAGLVPRARFEVSHLATAGALVAEGLGVTALPALTLPVIPRSGLLRRPLGEPAIVRRIGLVYATGRTLSPAAAAFRDLLERLDLEALTLPPAGGSQPRS